ncbi:alpha/beta hydrolase domain-containing protein [Streptomyces sp. NBC_00124]|uniref:alpha/beta hydrolase domain-containing protein n=1 Tax=Streptomyces sp. NBC_00124 TaxID=2975662 RepID=UPI002252880D|nr:alpha/beta hydrolase domain-containing protein [Streptomyces sp. NBC_00124]MCX5366387.1 alpha/beta hydrolase domain-containing protein [Streptomyces sp. NBC_00124]
MSGVQLEVHTREPFAEGHHFVGTGAYEVVTATAHYSVNPEAAAHHAIPDLALAPRDGTGRVRFSGDVEILRPVDGGRRRLFFDWGNRGNKRAVQYFCDAPHTNRPRTLAHAGNGYLLRRGYTVVFGAWQGDLLPGDGRLLLDLPVARRDGEPVRGLTTAEFIVEEPTGSLPLSRWSSTRSNPVSERGVHGARLTRRRYAHSTPEELPRGTWRFARSQGGAGDLKGRSTALVPSRHDLHLDHGFQPGWIYELVYEAQDPLVLGLGLVAVRDLVSHLRHDPARPVGPVDHAYGWGRSQTGRAIRDFIHLGFNEDLEGRRVFDGLLPHVSGAGRLGIERFTNLTVPGGQQYEDHLSPADTFPFAYAETVDHVTGERDAIMKRPSDPKVLHTQTSTEYWQRRGSLVHTTTDGRDLGFPPNVRGYLWSSSQHVADPAAGAPSKGICNHPENAVATSAFFRAVLDALDAWVSEGVEPPPSAVPTVADGTLVTADEWSRQFPAVPSALRPSGPNELYAVDRSTVPPVADRSRRYAVLVPAVDPDGNEAAGVRAPMVAVPLATYTGWNTRAPGQGHGALHEFSGSTFSFAATEDERLITGDPRPSVQKRHRDAAEYTAAIRAAAEDLAARRFLLAEDVERAVATAANWSAPRHRFELP